jgi:hypothetical protein
MNHYAWAARAIPSAVVRAATGRPTVARLTIGRSSLGTAPIIRKTERIRSFQSPSFLQQDATESAKELSRKSVEEEEQRVVSPTSAQKRADDRPWQREGNNTQPDATSPDPSGGDSTKGTSPTLSSPTRVRSCGSTAYDMSSWSGERGITATAAN